MNILGGEGVAEQDSVAETNGRCRRQLMRIKHVQCSAPRAAAKACEVETQPSESSMVKSDAS
jgi:hypothetical protein